ncbi:MAG TPA: acyl carrier protein [Petrotogaceae bacterium]|jgi:acyl carrier protein|nr:acyl carrier protein [Petrotogaceae bacterium]HNY37253.1 acyl carrier protein [Petrotogaceae bacterium]HOT31806.1 acyl carrier protein [Petrotogaceae bacterium]HQH33633.1 acyl carrier protein [Petrotogaceae bacterium]HQI79044.1 acyl carrier protein [Petrotogaceae bacterium]
MNKAELFDKVRDIICEKLDVEKDKVTLQAVLTDDLGADSLELVDLAMEIESSLGTAIADSELEKIKTVGDVVETLLKKM